MPDGPPQAPLLLTVAQASRALSLSPATIFRLLRRGELPRVHVGAALRIPYAALAEFVSARTAAAAAPAAPVLAGVAVEGGAR